MTSFYIDFNEKEIKIKDLENITKKYKIYSFDTNDKYHISYISKNQVNLNYISDKELIEYFNLIKM